MNIVIQIPLFHIAVHPPHFGQQKGTGKGLPRAAQKGFQKISFPAGYAAGAKGSGQCVVCQAVGDISKRKLA